jgi:hypothetical protein
VATELDPTDDWDDFLVDGISAQDSKEAYNSISDINSHPRGRLTSVWGTTRTNSILRIHFVLPNLCTIGCSKIDHPAKYIPVSRAIDYPVL